MEEGGQAYPDDSHHQDFSTFTRGFQDLLRDHTCPSYRDYEIVIRKGNLD